MASIDRVEALANQYKKKKKINSTETSLTVIEDLANEIKSGNKNAAIEYMGTKPNAKWKSELNTIENAKAPYDEHDTAKHFKSIGNTISGVAGNFLMGIESTIPKAMNMVDELQSYVAKKASVGAMDLLLRTTPLDEEQRKATSNILGTALGEKSYELSDQLSPGVKSANKVVNSEEAKKWRNETIQKNTEKAKQGGAIGEFANDVALGVGQNVIPMGLSFIPGGQAASAALFVTSAGGSYLEDADQRGMNEDQRIGYAVGMGIFEGGFDYLLNGVNVNRVAKLFGSGQLISKQALKSAGFSALENAAQEGLTEPITELAADIAGGYGDWEDIGMRSLRSAAVGAVSGLIFDAGAKGVTSAVYTTNVQQNTNTAIQTARQQLGRELTTEETEQITKQVKEHIKAQMIEVENLSAEERAEIEKLSTMSTEDMVVTALEAAVKSGKVDTNAVLSEVGKALNNQNIAPVDNTAQVEGLQQSIEEKQNELKQSQDAREQQIIQEEIDNLNQELTETTNAQQITNESDLRKQKFTYQAQETDSDIKKTVYESASQVMNNTEKSHKLVDVVAKIAEEKGTIYKFTNNEQLKQMGFAKENVTVNGLINKNGEVLINIDSAKALNTVVGHETTHLLEGTKEYEALKQIAIEYSKSKGDYDTKMAQLHSLYKDTDANLENELVSDIVGDYLFTDENFIKELSVKQPTVFEKIKNFISDLVVKFKGTEQEKQLRQIQRSFEKAYKTQSTQTRTEVKYSLSENGKMVDTSTNSEVKLEAAEAGTHGTLMAIHNLNESKFKGVLELGGFPVPSIAITNNVHEDFGDISVLFDKAIIDPSNKLNEAYDRDVWSTRVPRTVNKFASNIENVAANLGLKSYELREKLEGSTIEAATERLLREAKVIDKIFADKNIQVEQVENVYKNKEPQGIYHKSTEIQNFIKENDITYQKLMEDSELREGYFGVLKEWAREKYKNSLLQSKLVDGLPPYIVSLEEQLNKDAENGYYEGDLYVQSLNEDFNKIKNNEQELDEYATKTAQRKAKDLKVEEHKVEIENYIREQLETINEGKYFEKEGVDPYTDNGRKSFSQLHTKYTLENLVKAMKKKSTIAGESLGTPGFGEIQAAMAKKFTSIEDIKASESQIVPKTQEVELTKPLRDTIWNDIIELSKGYKYYNPNADAFDYDNQHGEDNASQSLFDLANSKKITLENFKKILNENLIDSNKIPDSVLEKTINDLVGLRNIPTEYFEVKPQRAVGFDEVQAVVIPNTASNGFKQQLQEAGIKYYEYDPNIEGDRQRVTNQFDDLKFSLSAQNEDIAPRDPKQIYGEDVKLQVEEAIAPLQETIKELTEQVKTIQENFAPTSQDIVEQQGQEAGKTLTDEDMLPIAEDTTPEVEDDTTTESKVESPFDERDIKEVGKRSVKAYQYENPEVRPYFQQEAGNMLNDLDNTVKGEKTVTQVYNPYTGLYENAEWTGTTRQTTEAIAYLRDNYKYSYAQIRKGLNDIIEDNGKENNAVAKRIEFMLDERLREGYTTSDGFPIPPNEEYINFLKEKQVTEYDRERLEALAVDENAPETEEVAEQTTTNAEPEQANALEQYEATLQDELSPTVNPEHIIEHKPIDTSFMRESTKKKLENYETLREKYNIDKQKSLGEFNVAIAKKTAEYEGLTNKNTKKANNLLQQIANLEIRKANVQDDYNRRIEGVSKRIDSMATQKFEQNEKKASQSEIREQLFKDTGIVSESLDHAKNISKALMHNTDPIRLQEMIFGKELGGKINKILFQQVKHNTAEKIRFQNKERSEIENLGIKPRSKESAAVQKYGEKQYVDEAGQTTKYGDSELKAEFPNVEDQEKIKKAARVIRGKYDTYIDMVNAEITKYGYDAIPKRQDYMRHFQELNDVFSRYGLPFNMQSAQANDLPVDINGLTADLKPGKNWFASALRRKGVKTTYDAISGIDGYIEGIGNLIYHTGDIQKLRGFEDYIREIYGQEHGFDNLDNLPEAEKATRMNKIQDNHLGNYAAWIREYTNALAGKKAMVDRAFEDVFGRRIYSTLNEIKSQVGSNMVGLNIGSALTNPISMTQALAKTSKAATVKGYADTIKNIFIKDNFIEQNDFLTNRFGSDILSPTAWQKMRNAGQVFMTGTDWFASNAITRSKFYELKAKGLSDADAHKQAGDFAARILGDRSQGATPTLYNSKMLGLATQFQLEVNNQLYSMFYDTISDAKQEAKTKGTLPAAVGATFVLGQLAAYQHVYNNLYESIAGRRPAFDVIAMIATAFGIGGDDEDEEKTIGDRLFEAADMLVDSLPYVSIFTGGGRIPISEALPIAELFSGKDQYGNEKSRLETLGEAIPYYLLPTGYGQIKKTTSGLGMYDDDLPIAGSYTDSGNLRFTAEDDPMSILQAGIFGQWANPNAKEYIDSEFESIDKSNIDELVELGFDSKEYKDYKKGLNEIKKMELEDGESKAPYLFDYVEKQDVTEEQKSIMIKHLLGDKELENLDSLNMSAEQTIDYYEARTNITQEIVESANNRKLLALNTESEEYKEAISKLSNDKKSNIIDIIKNTNLTDEQKAYLYGKQYSSDKTLEKVIESGIDFDDFLTYSKDSLALENSEDKADYLYNADMTDETKTVIYETSVLSGFDNEKKYKDYKTVKAAGIDINSWLSYSKQEFKADKNSEGKSISGSRKRKIFSYVNSLSLSIPQKAIIIRTEYPSEDKYNKQIVNYVSGLDLSHDEKVNIFENLDMTVKDNRVYWD